MMTKSYWSENKTEFRGVLHVNGWMVIFAIVFFIFKYAHRYAKVCNNLIHANHNHGRAALKYNWVHHFLTRSISLLLNSIERYLQQVYVQMESVLNVLYKHLNKWCGMQLSVGSLFALRKCAWLIMDWN